MGLIAGITAPANRTMGHSGAFRSSFGGDISAGDKVKAWQRAGIQTVLHPGQFGEGMKQLLNGVGKVDLGKASHGDQQVFHMQFHHLISQFLMNELDTRDTYPAYTPADGKSTTTAQFPRSTISNLPRRGNQALENSENIRFHHPPLPASLTHPPIQVRYPASAPQRDPQARRPSIHKLRTLPLNLPASPFPMHYSILPNRLFPATLPSHPIRLRP